MLTMRAARSEACEFVTDGHPDKVCDQMADAIVDAALAQDPHSRVAMEVTGGHGLVFVTGELTTSATIDVGALLREKYRQIGHDYTLAVSTNVVAQSANIKVAADRTGAGDQGVMTGYAVSGNSMLMPRAWTLARALCVRLREARLSGSLPWLRPDGKSLVALDGEKPIYVVIAAHHQKGIKYRDICQGVLDEVVGHVLPGFRPVLRPEGEHDGDWNCVINGTDAFEEGGFEADAGTTGRKLCVDNYGPNVEIGGGCYSGKDPSKVDRSAAYFCRFVAKSIVAFEHSTEAMVKVGYGIGMCKPAFISVETSLPGHRAVSLERKVRAAFDFRPAAIIERLDLLKPAGWNYQQTAAMGHFGDERFPWERAADF